VRCYFFAWMAHYSLIILRNLESRICLNDFLVGFCTLSLIAVAPVSDGADQESRQGGSTVETFAGEGKNSCCREKR